jgi:hypothetical protein
MCQQLPQSSQYESLSLLELNSFADGIENDHAYGILDLNEAKHNNRVMRLLLIRNPWGKSGWTGAWSIGSPEYNSASPQFKQLADEYAKTGVFFMEFGDFQRYFEKVQRSFCA